MTKDFAKLINAADGSQVLCYIEPRGDTYLVHQITETDCAHIDVSVTLKKEDAAYAFVHDYNEASATKLRQIIKDVTGEVQAKVKQSDPQAELAEPLIEPTQDAEPAAEPSVAQVIEEQRAEASRQSTAFEGLRRGLRGFRRAGF